MIRSYKQKKTSPVFRVVFSLWFLSEWCPCASQQNCMCGAEMFAKSCKLLTLSIKYIRVFSSFLLIIRWIWWISWINWNQWSITGAYFRSLDRQVSLLHKAVWTDPGFPVAGDANPPGDGGANIWFCQNFWKKGGKGAPLLDPHWAVNSWSIFLQFLNRISLQTFLYNSILLTGLDFNCTFLSVALAPHRLQCCSKLYTKVCIG